MGHFAEELPPLGEVRQKRRRLEGVSFEFGVILRSAGPEMQGAEGVEVVHEEGEHRRGQSVKDLGMLMSCAVEWEDRWNGMAKKHKNPLPTIWKTTALMELCPPEVQGMVYQNTDEVDEDTAR